MKFVVMLAFVALAASSLQARAFCLQPDAPRCLRTLDTSDDQSSFDLCRRQMQRYLDEVNDFTTCVREEADRAVKQFNCKARRESFCR